MLARARTGALARAPRGNACPVAANRKDPGRRAGLRRAGGPAEARCRARRRGPGLALPGREHPSTASGVVAETAPPRQRRPGSRRERRATMAVDGRIGRALRHPAAGHADPPEAKDASGKRRDRADVLVGMIKAEAAGAASGMLQRKPSASPSAGAAAFPACHPAETKLPGRDWRMRRSGSGRLRRWPGTRSRADRGLGRIGDRAKSERRPVATRAGRGHIPCEGTGHGMVRARHDRPLHRHARKQGAEGVICRVGDVRAIRSGVPATWNASSRFAVIRFMDRGRRFRIREIRFRILRRRFRTAGRRSADAASGPGHRKGTVLPAQPVDGGNADAAGAGDARHGGGDRRRQGGAPRHGVRRPCGRRGFRAARAALGEERELSRAGRLRNRRIRLRAIETGMRLWERGCVGRVLRHHQFSRRPRPRCGTDLRGSRLHHGEEAGLARSSEPGPDRASDGIPDRQECSRACRRSAPFGRPLCGAGA